MRAVGPALCGNIWALSVHSGLPGQQFLPFAAVSAVMLVTRLLFMLADLQAIEK